MTTPIALLIMSLAILLIINMIQATIGIIGRGIPASLGNREAQESQEGFNGRLARTKANTVENLLLFAPLMAAAVGLGVENDLIVYGGMTYIAARVLYTFAYMAGIPGLRTVTWVVGVGGTVAVAIGLLP